MASPYEPAAIRLRKPLRLRDAGELIELHDPQRDEWAKMAPWTREPLLAMADGGSVEAFVEREPRVRRLVMSLAKVGYVEVVVEPPSLPGYPIERELGRGGVGIAYLARRADDGTPVVVKRAWGFLHPVALARAALAREAETLRALRSPHVVRFVDELEYEGHRCLVRGLAAGAALVDLAPGTERARRVAECLGEALDDLHRAGFALADHKPGNLFDDGKSVVLVDVGNARPLDLRAKAGGTRGFAAPEKVATVEADVYGYGRMVAFALTGRLFRDDPALDAVLEGIEGETRDALAAVCAQAPGARPSLAQARALLAKTLA